jgi:predicted metalloprotease
MRLDDQRRSENIEDRRGQRGSGGGGFGGGLPLRTGGIGLGGLVIVVLLFLFVPGLRAPLLGLMGMDAGTAPSAQPGVQGCAPDDQGCGFIAQVLGSTEDVWDAKFRAGALPHYGSNPAGAYPKPVLVLFSDAVRTGCGNAMSSVGPFYCPPDNKLYIDPTFYEVMDRRLRAPGDFAQAYVIAHEVGHHVQQLIGATAAVDDARNTPLQNQMSVRLELQADCFAGVWGHDANRGGQLSPGDLQEALNAAHRIGDDTLQRQSQGYVQPSSFTHGSSDQRMRWFKQGFETGDPRQCDTFAVRDFRDL